LVEQLLTGSAIFLLDTHPLEGYYSAMSYLMQVSLHQTLAFANKLLSTLEKIRESLQTSSQTFDVHTNPRSITNPSPIARYTLIKHSPTHIQIIRHSRGTQIPPIKFIANACKNEKNACIVVRSSTKMIYKITKSASGYEGTSLSVGDDGEESYASRGVKGYTDVDRERDLSLARAAGSFFIAFLEWEAEEQDKRDEEEYVFV